MYRDASDKKVPLVFTAENVRYDHSLQVINAERCLFASRVMSRLRTRCSTIIPISLVVPEGGWVRLWRATARLSGVGSPYKLRTVDKTLERVTERVARTTRAGSQATPPKTTKTTPRKKTGKLRRLPILEKDQKILWARAAGRCSITDCRAVVTLDPSGGDAATVGCMAHIVGYESNSARSRSSLESRERNSYANLILLCGHHHAIIDKDPRRYEVSVLHQIKTEHEQWVNESLSASSSDPDVLVHADLVDTITTALQLDSWIPFIENANLDMVHEEFLDARGTINARVLAAIWPTARPELTIATKELARAFSDYISHFLTNAELADGWFKTDKSYKRFFNPHFDAAAGKAHAWSERNFALLCRYVCNLNRFADAVRSSLNPMYFRLQGRFLLVDSMGYRLTGGGFLDVTEELASKLLDETHS